MEQLNRIMQGLGVSREEAAEILAADLAIDKGEKLFELTPEQKKAAKSAARADSKPRATTPKREKASDPVKVGLIELLSDVIQEQPACNSVEMLNPEREFLFMWSGKKFKITLSCPRS